MLDEIQSHVECGQIDDALSLLATHYRVLDQWPRALVLYADCIRMQSGCFEPLYVRAIEQLSLPSPHPSFLPIDCDFIERAIPLHRF